MTEPATHAEQPAPAAERGVTRVADQVVERIATRAARDVDTSQDTHSTWTDLVRRGLPRASAVVAGGTTRIRVDVAAQWPYSLPELTARVRDHVSERVSTLAGMTVTGVDVRVEDVVYDQTPLRRVQ